MATQKANTTAQVAKRETVDLIQQKIRQFQNAGELFFPAHYSPENALKSAWLILQQTLDKDKKPVLEVCTKDSIANCLLSMVIQGLNPDKKQCYFIAYGSALTLQRSYFGSIAVAKRIDENIDDVYADVVYKGDEFKYSKKHGKNIITEHIQQLENISKGNIVAAYAVVVYQDGSETATIMTYDEIKQAWRQSRAYPFDGEGNLKADSIHGKFTAEMCKKTVINRACKAIINTSDDSSLVVKYAKLTQDETAEAEVRGEIEAKANAEVIDIEYSEVNDETLPPVAPQPEPENEADNNAPAATSGKPKPF
jgi:recombination protein RecT